MKLSCKERSFTLSVSAMKNMLSSVVDTSKACGLFKMSSAPLIERQRLTCSHKGAYKTTHELTLMVYPARWARITVLLRLIHEATSEVSLKQ